MMLLAFEICWTIAFALMLLVRCLTSVTFEFGYDEFLIAGLAFGLGMLFREYVSRRS